MTFPIKICAICKEEFELKPDKPGFANRCPQCTEESSASESTGPATSGRMTAEERKSAKEADRRLCSEDRKVSPARAGAVRVTDPWLFFLQTLRSTERLSAEDEHLPRKRKPDGRPRTPVCLRSRIHRAADLRRILHNTI